MPIFCCEKCLHQQQGLCTLDHIKHATGNLTTDCVYHQPMSLYSIAPSIEQDKKNKSYDDSVSS